MDGTNSGNKKPIFFALLVLVGTLIAVAGLLIYTSEQNKNTPAPVKQAVKPQLDPVVRPRFVLTGLSFPTAVVSASSPADSRLFVTQLGGTIKIVNTSGQLEEQPYLDISQKVLALDEMGLLGIAFHPNYTKNGYFYVNYVDKQQNTIIARYKVSNNVGLADPASEKVLLKLKQPYPNHNGGDLAFGPDGYLYIALGDGGSAGDPENRAQDKSNLFGKILRVDVDKGDPYGIPPTNPFVGQQNVKTEIWAYGLRNPWRISFDKTKGDLFMADVGQDKYEEVNFQATSSKGGENYGWRCFEANQSFNPSGCQDSSKYVTPIITYSHEDDRCSVTGGYVYRGLKYSALEGKYFYGDFCSGHLYYAELSNKEWKPTLVAKTPYMISAFGQDNLGELYFTDYTTGSLYQLEDSAN